MAVSSHIDTHTRRWSIHRLDIEREKLKMRLQSIGNHRACISNPERSWEISAADARAEQGVRGRYGAVQVVLCDEFAERWILRVENTESKEIQVGIWRRDIGETIFRTHIIELWNDLVPAL